MHVDDGDDVDDDNNDDWKCYINMFIMSCYIRMDYLILLHDLGILRRRLRSTFQVQTLMPEGSSLQSTGLGYSLESFSGDP